jgi:hypothetical protein
MNRPETKGDRYSVGIGKVGFLSVGVVLSEPSRLLKPFSERVNAQLRFWEIGSAVFGSAGLSGRAVGREGEGILPIDRVANR